MGMKALSYSAQVSGEEDEKLDSKDMALTIAVSAGLAILLFIVIPTWSMRFITDFTQDHMALNLAEGVLRMAIFLAYIAAIFCAWRFSLPILPQFLRCAIFSACFSTTVRNTKPFTLTKPGCR